MQTHRFQYRKILEILHRHEVECIIVGGVCAVAHGAPVTTFDLDVVYRQAAGNIDRIIAALGELEARHREPGDRRLPPQRKALECGGPSLFTTKHGALDLLGNLGEGRDFEALLPRTTELTVNPHLRVRILDLETLIAVKERTGRPKDMAALPVLRQTLAEIRRRNSE